MSGPEQPTAVPLVLEFGCVVVFYLEPADGALDALARPVADRLGLVLDVADCAVGLGVPSGLLLLYLRRSNHCLLDRLAHPCKRRLVQGLSKVVLVLHSGLWLEAFVQDGAHKTVDLN